MARLGVLCDKNAAERRWCYGINVFAGYLGEVLSHTGISYQWIDDVFQVDNSYDILLVAFADDNPDTASVLWNYVEQGGTAIAYGGLQSLASKLSCSPMGNSGVGYYKSETTFEKAEFVRFMNAQPWKTDLNNDWLVQEVGEITQGDPNGPPFGVALQGFQIGKGCLERWSIDILGSIVAFQQGAKPVLEDGFPAPDGTAALNEGILKADDGVELDWEWDRITTETGMPYFAYPYADFWREILIGHLLKRTIQLGLTLPFIGYWPEGIECVAIISHDSDGNKDEYAMAALELLKECDVHSTWCMLEPGYSAPIYENVKEAGHELAFHYNALDKDGGQWGGEEFTRQLSWLTQAANIQGVTTNKNHYTRFEGWGELFEWCEKSGIQLDQTRGPSKKGNVGFLFGTCHPYFPIAWANERNRIYDVVEIGFLTQDMDLDSQWADSSVIIPFLEGVRKVEGVAHFLFHQVHIHNKKSVRDAFRRVVADARERGFTFWTGAQINNWYRGRRKMRINSVNEQTGAVTISGQLLPGTVVFIPVSYEYVAVDDEQLHTRFGVRCRKQVVTIHE